MQPVNYYAPSRLQPAPAPLPKRHARRYFSLAVVALALVWLYGWHHVSGKPISYAAAIRLATTTRCLDAAGGNIAAGSMVETANCSGAAGQRWTTSATEIHSSPSLCISIGSAQALKLAACTGAANQIWLREQQGFYNPATNKCLAAGTEGGNRLRLVPCSQLGTAATTWTLGSVSQAPACTGDESARLACAAANEWAAWTAAGSDHEALLTKYTDGTPYEAWCADFISYLYKEAGYPFTAGSADGWDQNDANQVQNMGFIRHDAGSGYVPRTGDVAFFSYPGGHVELVLSGGPTPTFLYGDSATIDPATGNGQMKANTITQDGEEGQLLYYLSPVT